MSLAFCKLFYYTSLMKRTQPTPRRSACPISFGLDLFGDKWTLLIMRDMLLFGDSRYSDFAYYEGISTNILADRLSILETAGVVTKSRDPVRKNQNIYQPTQKGRDLLPLITEMMLWGLRYDELTPADSRFVSRIETERPELASRIIAEAQAGTFEAYRSREMKIDANLYERSNGV